MFNGTAPISGSNSLQSYGDGQFLPEQQLVMSGNKCSVCNKTFERLYNLKVHLRKHTGETPYDCPIKTCKKQFKWRSSMAHHVRAHHDVSETIGIEVKCQARRSDQNSRYSNVARKSTAESMTSSVPGLSAGVKKTARRKATPVGLRVEQALQESGFSTQMHIQTQNICAAPQWGIGHSFQANVPNFMQDIQPTAVTTKEPEHGKNHNPNLESIHGEEMDSKEETKDDGHQLLEMVSEIFSRSTDMLQDCEESVPQMHTESSNEALDSGLLFLADGSEDATDAEMESLAHCGGNLSVSTSRETQTSSDIAFALP